MNNESEYVVRIPVSSCSSPADMCDWTIEHGLECVQWQAMHTENAFGRGKVVGFSFVFTCEEDAAAFKLRWM